MCDPSCLKCNGPTNKNCIQCNTDVKLDDGQCICEKELLMYDGICVVDCPQFFRKDYENHLCIPDPCDSNCKSCNNIKHKCSECLIGKSLLNESCVDACPLYTENIENVCHDKIILNKYRNATYIEKAFFQKHFANPEISNNFVSNFTDFNGVIPPKDMAQFSNCKDTWLYGGSHIYGQNRTINYTWEILWDISSVRAEFRYGQIENYDEKTESVQIYFNDEKKSEIFNATHKDQLCGNRAQNDTFGTMTVNKTNLKKGDTLILSFQNNFSGTAKLESFGIREFFIIVDRCTTNCQVCKDNVGCIKCYLPTFVYQTVCVDKCPPGLYGDIPTTYCLACHNNCLECDDKYDNSCTKCKSDKYLYKKRCLASCPTDTLYQLINECQDCPHECICKLNQCMQCIGKNRVKANYCKCINGYTDKAGKDQRLIQNCIKKNDNPIPKLELVLTITPTKSSYQIVYLILKFDRDVQIKEYKNWQIELQKANKNAYQIIEFSPLNLKKFNQFTTDVEIESFQQFNLTMRILDPKSINSNLTRIDFIDIYQVQDANENPLAVSFVEEPIPILIMEDEKDSFDEKPKESGFNLWMNCFMGILTLLLLLFLPPYQAISIYDLLQVINLQKYLNVQYSSYLVQFFKIFDIYNIFVLPIVKQDNSVAPHKFGSEDIDTFIFFNLPQAALLWLVFYIIYLVSKLGSSKNVKGKLKNILQSYNQIFKYKVIYLVAYISYCNMILYSFLQLQNSSFDTAQIWFGKLMALIFLVYFLFLTYFTYQSTKYTQKQLLQDDRLKSLYSFFFDGIKMIKGKNIIYFLILLRRTFLVGIVVFCQAIHIKQTLLYGLIIGVETMFYNTILPFKLNSENNLHLFCRKLLILSLMCVTALGIDDVYKEFSSYQRLVIGICIMVFCATVFFTLLLYYIYKNCKEQISKMSNNRISSNKVVPM